MLRQPQAPERRNRDPEAAAPAQENAGAAPLTKFQAHN
jgi:hypothetical protein